MKILYVLDQPNLYGSEQHVLGLIQAMKAYNEVTLLAFDEGPLLQKLRELGIPFHVILMSWSSVLTVMKLCDFFRKGSYDVIHAHQPKAVFWASIAARLVGTPCIITIHSLPSSNIQTYRAPLKKCVVGIFHFFVKFSAEIFSSRVIYLSRFSFRYAAFKKKSLVIPNWLAKLVPDEQICKTYGNPIRLISVGSVTSNKGMDRLIDSLSFIKNENWILDIIGDCSNDFKLILSRAAEEYGIKNRIRYLGYKDNVQDYLLKSDGFILLSRGETFGLVYIEAMNCGLPIIAWNIPVVHEILSF